MTTLILVLFAGLMWWPLTVAAAERPAAARAIARAQTAAPRFSPGLPMRAEQFAKVSDFDSVHFDFDRAAIRRSQVRTLDSHARWLKENKPFEILIEAYADERGTEAYNVALAERRARAVRDQLVARGVDADRIVIVGHGEARPVCTDKHEPCWAQNRRADILIRQARQDPSS